MINSYPECNQPELKAQTIEIPIQQPNKTGVLRVKVGYLYNFAGIREYQEYEEEMATRQRTINILIGLYVCGCALIVIGGFYILWWIIAQIRQRLGMD